MSLYDEYSYTTPLHTTRTAAAVAAYINEAIRKRLVVKINGVVVTSATYRAGGTLSVDQRYSSRQTGERCLVDYQVGDAIRISVKDPEGELPCLTI